VGKAETGIKSIRGINAFIRLENKVEKNVRQNIREKWGSLGAPRGRTGGDKRYKGLRAKTTNR